MQVSNHGLFLAVSRTAGIRSLGVNHLYGKLREAMPHHEVRTVYEPATNLATVSVRLSSWWWCALGFAHLVTWFRVRRAVRESLRMVQSDIRTEIRWPRNRI